MRILVSRLIVVLAVMTLGVSAAAEMGQPAMGQLSGHVRNQSGTPIVGASVEVLDPSTFDTLGSDTTDATGAYSIDIANGTYDVLVIASGYPNTFVSGIVVAGSRTLDFALESPTATMFNGLVLDLAGAGIPSQSIQLIRDGGEVGVFTTTNAAGAFSFQVETGSYFLLVNGDNQGFTVEGPQFYRMQTAPFDVTGDETPVVFTLPVKRVTVHVQRANGTAVAGAGLSSTSAVNCALAFGPGPPAACGASNYDASSSPNATTDGAGNVTLFLFPTPTPQPGLGTPTYALTATPPASSGLASGSISGVQIVNDTLVTITLNPPTVLTGRLLDGTGAGISNQSLTLIADGQESGVGTTTGADGGFSFDAQPGAYRLSAFGDNQAFTANAPQAYSLNSGVFTLSASQTIDFQLPVKRVDVHVQDSGGSAVANVALSTTAVNNCQLSFGPTTACGASNYMFSGPTSVTNAAGNIALWLFPTPTSPSDSYQFTATPPSGSGLAPTSLSGIEFTSNTMVTITLATPVTVSGLLLDRTDQGIPNQFLELAPADGGAAIGVTTSATGNYSIQVQRGSYGLNAFGDNQSFTAAAPQFYSLSTGAFSVSGNQGIDLAVPVKRLDVHLQDSSGNPIAHVGLSALGPTNCQLAFGPSIACGSSQYFYHRPGPGEPPPSFGVTDASGNLTLWLFPTPAGPDRYALTATPLADSGFGEVSVAGVMLTADATLVIVLNATQPPVTEIEINPPANDDDTHPDPVTITLTATAAAGFSIDITFYEVDGGDLLQYDSPFQVSGVGPHVIRYFSQDNAGVQEPPRFFNFTLATTDRTPPVTTATVSPAANAAGWHREDATVELNAVDEAGGSGVQNITYTISGAQATPASVVFGNAAIIPITVEGVSIVTFFATDNAGNVEADQTVTVRLDKTSPNISGVATPAANANGWNKTAVTVTFNCSDSISGLAAGSPPPPTTLSTEGVGQSVTGTCTDVAGNAASNTVSGIKIDLTAPEAYSQFDPATHDVALFGRDALSGVPAGPIAPSSVVAIPVNGELRTYNVVDLAGNVLQLKVIVHKGPRLLTVQIVSAKYGSAAVTMLPFNFETFTWSLRSNGSLKELDQLIWSGPPQSSLVRAEFVASTNRTKITRLLPLPIVQQVRTGLVLLRLATSHGTLAIEY